MGRGLLVSKGWGKAGRGEAWAEVETVPRSAPVGIAAAGPGRGASGVRCFRVCSSVALKALLGLSEIFGSALFPLAFEAVSVCDSDILGTRCDTAAVKQPPSLVA